jgi:hypothetical protein
MRMNLVRGLLYPWIVVSVIWFCVVGFAVYALWPQDPGPDDFPSPSEYLIPPPAHPHLHLLLVGAGIVLVGSGSMLLLGAAAIWVIRMLRRFAPFRVLALIALVSVGVFIVRSITANRGACAELVARFK